MREYGEAHLAAVAGTTEHHCFQTLDQKDQKILCLRANL